MNITKLLTKNYRLKIIRWLSKDLSLLINADVKGIVIPKTNDFYFNSKIEAKSVEFPSDYYQNECKINRYQGGGGHVNDVDWDYINKL